MLKQKENLFIKVILAVFVVLVIGIVIFVTVSRRQSEHSAQPYSDEYNHTESIKIPKMGLNEITRKAKTWRPVYDSWYGKTAPDFTLTDIEGKEHKLSDYRGKDVLLVFWATWCPPCLMEIPHLITLRKTIGKDRLAMLAISTEEPGLVKKFAARKKLNYTVLTSKTDMPEPYSYVRSIPSSFFIDPGGKIKLAMSGLISLGEIKAILQAE